MDNNPQSSFLQDPTRQIAERMPEPPALPQSHQSTSFPNLSPPTNPQMNQRVNDVSQLINLGKVQESVNLFGFTFQMRTLSARESADALRSFALISETSQAIDMSIATLARAIESVNGTPLELLYNSYVPTNLQESNLDSVSKRVAIIGLLNANVVSGLIGEYQRLTERSLQAIGTASAVKK